MKLTIFSVDVLNNGYYEQPLQQACIQSWRKAQAQASKFDTEIDIKLFTNTDKEFIEFKNQFDFDIMKYNPSHIADAFRMYILSKNLQYVWLDTDMFIYSTEKFLSNFVDVDYTFRRSFNFLYSGSKNKIFENIFEQYVNNRDLIKLQDNEVSKLLSLQDHFCGYSGVYHLYFIDNYYLQQNVPIYMVPFEYSYEDAVKEIETTPKQQFRRKHILITLEEKYKRTDYIYKIPKSDELVDLLESFSISIKKYLH